MVERKGGGGGNRTRVTVTSNLRGVPCAEDGVWCSHPTRSREGSCARSATIRFGSVALCWQHAEEFRAEARHAEYEAEIVQTQERERRRQSVGVIYAIQAQWAGGGSIPAPVKIGYTSSEDTLPGRLATLQTSHWLTLKIIWIAPGTQTRERELHRELRDHHIRGEWFDPHPALWDVLEAIAPRLAA